MKLSSETLSILKNFASININMMFRQGSVVSSISNANNIFAKATIKETLPVDFAIYDLNSLLAMLSIRDSQDIEFGDKSLTISSGVGKFEYFYSNADIVVAAPVNEIAHVSVYDFKLTAEDVQTLMKAAAITGAPTISVTSRNNFVTISVNDRSDATANSYSKDIGSCMTEFDAVIAVENLKVMGDSYTVSVAKIPSGKAKFLYFKSDVRDLQYWIACTPKSVI